MIEAKFTWDIKGLEKKMGALANKVIPYMKVTMGELAKFAHAQARAATPPPAYPDSTPIRDMWEIKHTSRATFEEFVIKNAYKNQDVILFFEEGTKAHEIRPRHAKILHWVDRDTGKDIFAKLVHHPGTPKYAMIAQAERATKIKIDQYMQRTSVMIDRITAG